MSKETDPMAPPLEAFIEIQSKSDQDKFDPDKKYNKSLKKKKLLKPGHLWERLFTVVLAPFLIFGIPTHILFGKFGNPNARSTFEWLKSIFIPFNMYVPISIIFLISTAFGTYAVVRWIYLIFHSLVILGEINFEILDSIYNLVQSLPIFLPTICIWLFGNSLKNILHGFDLTQFQLEKLIQQTCSETEFVIPKYYSAGSLLKKVFGVYFLIGSMLAVNLLLDFCGIHLPGSQIFYFEHDYWYGVYIFVSYNFVLALYIMISWGLQCQLTLFSYYLTSLMSDELRPTSKILSDVKYFFKKLAEQIVIVNRAFSLLVSFVIFLLILFAALHTLLVILYAIPSSVTVILKLIKRYLKDFGIEFELDVPWAHLHYDNETDNSTSLDTGLEELKSSVIDRYGPIFIRTTVGYIYLVVAQMGLIFFLGQQAVQVNTMMRYFSVQFNDYMSSNSGTITTDLYQEYRIVRFYIVSALNFPGKWIILRLPIMAHFPIIKNKIIRTQTT